MGLDKKRVLFILAEKNFRDEEFLKPKDILKEKKLRIDIANTTGKDSIGMLGARTEVNLTLNKVAVNDYDAVIFIGGSGSKVYFDDKLALSIAKEAYLKGKIVCSICLASGILANAGVLSGKKATGWIDTKTLIEKSGGTYTGTDLEVSGRVITASGPKTATKFGEAILKSLSQNVAGY